MASLSLRRFLDTLSSLAPTSLLSSRAPAPAFRLLDLPTEILLEIIDLLADSDDVPSSSHTSRPHLQPLLALSRTNHQLRTLSLPALFRSFRLSPSTTTTTTTITNAEADVATQVHVPALDFLLNNPSIPTSHIRTLHIPWWPEKPEDPQTSDPYDAPARALAALIPTMRALRTLHVGGCVQGLRESWERADLEDETTTTTLFPQVQKLVLGPGTEWMLARCPDATTLVPDLWKDARMAPHAHAATTGSAVRSGPADEGGDDDAEEEEQWTAPEDMMRAAKEHATGLRRWEMTGYWDAKVLATVVAAVPGLTELGMEHRDGLAVLRDEGTVALLRGLAGLERLDVCASSDDDDDEQDQDRDQDRDRAEEEEAKEEQKKTLRPRKGAGGRKTRWMGPKDVEGLVRAVFGALPQLRTLEAKGFFRAEGASRRDDAGDMHGAARSEQMERKVEVSMMHRAGSPTRRFEVSVSTTTTS